MVVMNPLSLSRRRLYFFLLVLLFFILIPFLSLYTNGYRIDTGFRFVKTGGLYIETPLPESEIYINNRLTGRSNIIQRGLFEQNLAPGIYFTFVYKEGYWPWSKELTVREGLVSEGHAFLVPREPVIEEIPLLDPKDVSKKTRNKEYEDVLALFSNKILSPETITAHSTSTVTRKNVVLVRDENIIIAKWLGEKKDTPYYFCDTSREQCVSQALIFSSPSPIQTFDFLPERDDVVIIARRNGIYAIDADRRRMQNFALVYAGVNPDFRIDTRGTFFIKDEGKLYRLSFEI